MTTFIYIPGGYNRYEHAFHDCICIVTPGGGLGIPTDKDQRSWVFLKDQKKYFVTDRRPKKMPSEKSTPKKHPPKTRFVQQKLLKHDMIIMKNCVFCSSW